MTLLHDDPARLRCRHVDGFNIPLQNGLAAFRGLYINEAGMYYSIHLSTNVTLEGPTAIDSNVFSVGVGQAGRIELINDAALEPYSVERHSSTNRVQRYSTRAGISSLMIHPLPSEFRFTATHLAEGYHQPVRPLQYWRTV